jgi:hypothetical protein
MGSLDDNGIGEDFQQYSQSPSTITTIASSASSVVTGGTVDLTITETNDGTTNLTDPQVVVTQQGAMLATLTAAPDSGDVADPGVLNIGETWTWTIASDPITDDPTTFVATGSGMCPADIPVTFPGDPDEQDDVVVDVLVPSTITTIEADPPGPVVVGATVNLTVTEQNDGEVDLTSPYVEVRQEGALIATLNAPPDSGDVADPGVLNVGETWTWTIVSDPIMVDPTTFLATGFGTDPIGTVITYPGDPQERDTVDVALLVPSTITTITASESVVLSGETVDLTVTEENDGEVDLTNPYVEVRQQGALIATLNAPPDSGDAADPGVLNVGETWSWTITSNAITVDPTTFMATGFGTDPIGTEITYPGDPQERDTVTVGILMPSTIVTIDASDIFVEPGGFIDLYITEENDGDAELHDVQVVVNDGTSDIAVLTAPPDAGDDGDNNLDPGETWSWTIPNVGPINGPVTFTATGSGLDPNDNLITYPDDPEERDSVLVRPPVVGGDVYTESIAGILMPWLSLFGIIAVGSVLILQKKKWLLR